MMLFSNILIYIGWQVSCEPVKMQEQLSQQSVNCISTEIQSLASQLPFIRASCAVVGVSEASRTAVS